jgi:hypothetical protein
MRQWYMAIVLLAGCGFQHGITADDARRDDAPSPQDAPRDGDIDAPTDGAIDAMIDAPPTPTDTDGDGEPDTTDNCPTVMNSDQRDHDGDAHGDACDHCPHLASTTDPDGDGDGVGDDCDPRPMTGGDSIAHFEGFYDANSIATWNENGDGTWSVANGVLTQSSATASYTTNTLTLPVNLPRAAITAGARAIALANGTNGGSNPHVSVSSGVTQNHSYWCSVVHENSSDKIYATTNDGFSVNTPNVNWSGTFGPNSELRLTSALLGSNNQCTVVQGSTSGTTSGSIDPMKMSGAVQVATRSASASFDYVFVVSIGN